MCLGVFVQTNTHSIRAVSQPVGYVIQENGCWYWTGRPDANGYAVMHRKGEKVYVHRTMYEESKGPIPTGLHLDHLCRNRRCVNPDHLEPVTCRTNILRGVSPVAENHRKDTCKRGHALDAANTYVRPNGMRMCRACQRTPELRARKIADQRRRRREAKLIP